MKRAFFVVLALLLFGLSACNQSDSEEALVVSSEPGVITVFKSPT